MDNTSWTNGKIVTFPRPSDEKRVVAGYLVHTPKGVAARWTIAHRGQRLRKIDALAKSAAVWDATLAPNADFVEVWDKTDGKIYSLPVSKFEKEKQVLPFGEGIQYYVERDLWDVVTADSYR